MLSVILLLMFPVPPAGNAAQPKPPVGVTTPKQPGKPVKPVLNDPRLTKRYSTFALQLPPRPFRASTDSPTSLYDAATAKTPGWARTSCAGARTRARNRETTNPRECRRTVYLHATISETASGIKEPLVSDVADATTDRAQPRHSFFHGNACGSLCNAVNIRVRAKSGSEITRSALAGTLEIRFDARQEIAVLPVVADLNTADRTIHINAVRAAYAQINPGLRSSLDESRGSGHTFLPNSATPTTVNLHVGKLDVRLSVIPH